MAQAKTRNTKLAEGWDGFADRLDLAIKQRKREWGVSQNWIADSAGIESGQLTKILSGERARGVAANTVLLLAEALKVSPIWLMTNVEPSGLGRQQPSMEETGETSAVPREQSAKKTA